ncbi:chemotaxis protein CheW [Desulfurivibrio dismutans]|uniref:chemotaxis protein CheW n=1 Tax=Desulfurivibrio dismutans TaxID=1398908 RepID=UPI0023DBF2AF|nr:chemotaxis protein CheW [Desulfurivibrio alkaliphilus]MDF1615524.1 chemotaxis protein CheW [Desulfurivibrio alkaliphilus]
MTTTTYAERQNDDRQALAANSNQISKYLTFSLGLEEYGINIIQIREIIGLMPVTAIPRTPEHFRGVINLRGKVIPVIDLRRRFGMAAEEPTDRTCIVVVEISGRHGTPLAMGLVVDSVSEVLNIRTGDIEPAPSFGTELDQRFIAGIAKVGNKVKILLDIDRVLGEQELAQAAEMASAA